MSGIDVVLLGLALAVDAFVVSFSYGLILKRNRWRNAVSLGAATGLGQFVMPVAGWYGTNLVHGYIESIDHWIAFAVFLALGLKVIDEALSGEDEPCKLSRQLTFKVLLMIGLATNIDALVTGITLYFMNVSIWFAAPAIGIITFVCAVIGFQLNCCFKKVPTRYLEIAAGIILILLGCKVLYEHLSAE